MDRVGRFPGKGRVEQKLGGECWNSGWWAQGGLYVLATVLGVDFEYTVVRLVKFYERVGGTC